ncbi:hypothetical protein E6W39_06555 [Kitasatospora acidiphila]|uniref:Uncharacterized protein n=1 Tax=Kitasatospora acidiphila TaxID=2567942 RepID=A0A540VZ07_9ACTN|nr:hypothetical protein [Kitasatospora acidiphila]TQF01998.1 hypothetical protein E6W39_06555 [Kitasatospora acidiphila]
MPGDPEGLPRHLSPSQQARNVRAFSAVVAKFREALLEGPEALAFARDVVGAFADSGMSGGPTRSEVWSLIAERRAPQYAQEFFDSRWAIFEHYGAIQPYLAKKHQQRYALHPAVGPATLVHERLRRHRGIDELVALLDETRALIGQPTRDRATIEFNIMFCRQMLTVYAIHLERLVAVASIRELADEQREHNHPGLSTRVKQLNEEVSDFFPGDHALDHQAVALVAAEQHYQQGLTAAGQRVIEQGGRTLDFEVLSAEEYLEAARHAPLALLGQFGADLVVDPPSVWLDAGALMEAVEDFAPYVRVRRRPPMPQVPPEPDPAQRMGEARSRERSRQEHLAERVLLESDQADLTDELRHSRWRSAARLLADLIGLDADPYAPYRLRISIELIVDRIGWVTYLHPVHLHRQTTEPPEQLRHRRHEERHEGL